MFRARVDCPNQIANAVQHLARGFRDAIQQGPGSGPYLTRSPGHLAKDHDFRQGGSDVIVQVARNAGAHPLNAFEVRNPILISAPGQRCQQQTTRRQKPPAFPKMRQDPKVQR